MPQSMTIGELLVRIAIKSDTREAKQFQQGMQGIQRTAANAARAVEPFAKGLRVLGLALAAIGTASFKVGADVERGFLKLRTQLGATQEEIDSMRPLLEQLARDTGRSLADVVEGYFALRSSGQDASTAFETLTASVKASAIQLGSARDIAHTAGGAVNAYGQESLSGARAVDILALAVKEGNFEARELSGSMGKLLQVGPQLGIEFEQLATIIAKGTSSSIGAREVITQLEQVLSGILRPTETAKRQFDAMGISVRELQRRADEDLIGTLQGLRSELGDDKEAFSRLFESQEAVALLFDLTGPRAEQFRQTLENIQTTTGVVDEGFLLWGKSGFANVEQATNNLKLALTNFYDTVLVPLLQLFGKLPSAIQTVVLGMGAMQIASTIGLGPSVGGLVTSLGRFIVALKTGTIWNSNFILSLRLAAINVRGFVASLSLARVAQLAGAAATGVATAATWAFNAALLANPVGAVIAAIALALVAAAVIVRKYWEPIKAFFIGLWEGLQEALQPIKEAFGEVIAALEPLRPVLSAIGDAFGWVGDIIGKVVGWFTKLFDPVDKTSRSVKQAGDAGRTTGKIIGTLLLLPIKLIIGYFKLWIMIIRTLVSVFTWLRDTVGKVISTIRGLPILVAQEWGQIVGIVGGIWSRVNDTVRGWIQAIIDFVRELPGRVVGILKDIPGMVADAIRDVPGLGAAIEVFTGIAGKVGKAGFAEGGIVPGPLGRPLLATVHGGEMVLPVGASRVIAQMLEGFRLGPAALPQAPHYYGQMYRSSVTNRTVNINMNEPIVIQTQATDAKGIAQELGEAIQDQIRNIAYDHDGPVER